MRSRAPQFFAVVAVLLVCQAAGSTQVTYRPTPEPIVTAENTWWYLEGEPITYAGSIYYPTGPNVYFNPHEMVRSGDYQGIPLYTRTTIEPYSLVYVPLPGRIMKPYERRRAGDLAGTVGSTTPSFPVIQSPDPRDLPAVGQAAAPPMHVAPTLGTYEPLPTAAPPPAAAEPASTAGVIPPRGPLVSARKPEGLDGIFIDYRDRRWFITGPAVELQPGQFTRIGEYAGFPVYRKGDDQRTIYVAVSEAAGELLAQYSVRR
jgi:hypothetical protein